MRIRDWFKSDIRRPRKTENAFWAEPVGGIGNLALFLYFVGLSIFLGLVLLRVLPHPTPSGEDPTAALSVPGLPGQPTVPAPRYQRLACDTSVVVRVEAGKMSDPDCVVLGVGSPVVLWAEQRLLLMVLIAGALGSILHGLRSVGWYKGHRALIRSWVPSYLALPVIGSLVAFVFYMVVRGGFFSSQAAPSDTSPYAFAAVAALSGVFSSQAILKLKQIAESALAKPSSGEDAMPQGAAENVPGENAPAQNTPVAAAISIATTKNPGAAIAKALDQYRTTLWRPGVTSIGGGTKLVNGQPVPCIRVKVDKKLTDAADLSTLVRRGELLPTSVTVPGDSGAPISIPIDVIEDGVPTAHGFSVGNGICNDATPDNVGTLSAVVRSSVNGRCAATCYHIARADQPWTAFVPNANNRMTWVQTAGRSPIGTVVAGARDAECDFALIKLDDGIEVATAVGGQQPKGPRSVIWDDVFKGSPVRVFGGTMAAPVTASVIGLDETATLRYSDGSTQRFDRMISIGTVNGGTYQSVTKGGDSGALVLDADGTAIGIVVGGGASATYLLPLAELFARFGVAF